LSKNTNILLSLIYAWLLLNLHINIQVLETVIEVNELSKQYRLGLVGTTSIADDIKRYWARIKGKEDPTLKIGQSNVLAYKMNKTEDDYIWALKDINFEVKQGEVLGVIGKNGAGKSTLLKILSKVTAPTSGSVKIKGRIASLLEVGTGFHQELTGRENVFLNGAILGMTKAEIRSKFDEIVDFSGIERYIDTPVKRYSSGMYVRLAFAVAAHLEPEILILDEVLSVGDAEFQKKCLGKMQNVSQQEGRTVIFVSHNMAAVRSLCQRCILLSDGKVDTIGESELITNKYLSVNDFKNDTKIPLKQRTDRKGNGKFRFTNIQFVNKYNQYVDNIISGEPLSVLLEYESKLNFNTQRLYITIAFHDEFNNSIASFPSDEMGYIASELKFNGKITLNIPRILLRAGTYYIRLWSSYENTGWDNALDVIENADMIKILPGDVWHSGIINRSGMQSIIDGYYS
jgi:lipopolysaccharide transport system ATP-binding protein